MRSLSRIYFCSLKQLRPGCKIPIDRRRRKRSLTGSLSRRNSRRNGATGEEERWSASSALVKRVTSCETKSPRDPFEIERAVRVALCRARVSRLRNEGVAWKTASWQPRVTRSRGERGREISRANTGGACQCVSRWLVVSTLTRVCRYRETISPEPPPGAVGG